MVRHLSAEQRAALHIWESFVTGNEPELSHLAPAIRSSWLRSRRSGIDPHLRCAPLAHAQIEPEQLRHAMPWVAAAEAAFNMLRFSLTESHQLVLLTAADGRVLLSHAGNKARSRAEELHAVVGSNWSEDEVGCTAIGASLHDGVPVLASWCESYSSNWHDWVNQAVPIRDPITHALIGGLNVAGFREILHPRVLDLARHAAGLIEIAAGEQEWRLHAEVLARFNRLLSRNATDACIAVDRRGRLIACNQVAEKRLVLVGGASGQKIEEIEQLADRLGPANHDAIKTAGRPMSVAGAEVIEVATDRFAGALYILPAVERGRSLGVWPSRYAFADLIGEHPEFKACIATARATAREQWPVLITGESGTGKELFAHAIHAASPRRQGPFVSFSCAGINDDLVAAELFGYTGGSFTGAAKEGQIGKVELAHTGTLFLDDVDCMPPKMQASLLRVVEDQVILPVGATKPRQVDIRIIAATNAGLERACAEGRFRHDLYYRLNVLSVQLPPLRARATDIGKLALHLLSRLGMRSTLEPDVLRALADYSWPGNVRELRNVLVRSALNAAGRTIELRDLPENVRCVTRPDQRLTERPFVVSDADAQEREEMIRALDTSRSVVDAAAILGIHFTSAYRRMKKHGIDNPFKQRAKKLPPDDSTR